MTCTQNERAIVRNTEAKEHGSSSWEGARRRRTQRVRTRTEKVRTKLIGGTYLVLMCSVFAKAFSFISTLINFLIIREIVLTN